ncbi:molybdenum cofactor guanylyltransferase [Paenibacillus dokdonensis]|uniref:Probable molybdenum cofactor guanylyltransferase n=1 Tax=Paenibacillus dokdonensis TaxID=2567944 RepID=A0ABU6GQP1_9BACL|nr:molybdenum cofactor guanylyltransferase [Paenibacillus dokdonensis]MEC0242040.1 molybdenum cofactor guanylyltransferase [Paenibacillus dokdonensis]
MTEMTGVVLAGGKSSRMGKNKALLRMNGSETVIESVIQSMAAVTSRIIISANDTQVYEDLGHGIVSDLFPMMGPLSGLHAALTVAKTPWVIVSACDLPFVSERIFKYLKEMIEKQATGKKEPAYQGFIPLVDGRIQPLVAAYHISALPSLEKSLAESKLRMTDWLKELRICYIPEEQIRSEAGVDPGREFFNMNNPVDYKQALENDQDNNELDR